MSRVFLFFSRFFAALILGTVLIVLSGATTAQENTETWFDPNQAPILEKTSDLPRSEYSKSLKIGHKQTCVQAEELVRNFTISLPLWRQSVNACWLESPLGKISTGGNPYLKDNDRIVAGRFSGYTETYSLLPTTNENVMLEHRRNSSSNFTRFRIGPTLNTTSNLLGTVTHELGSAETFTLYNENGSVLGAAPEEINYSNNGRYAVAAIGNNAMLRIDLENKKIINFGDPIDRAPGWNPFMKIDVTNDGRYAVATGTANEGSQWMRLYDLADCEDGEYSFIKTVHANCTYLDFGYFLANNIPGFNRFGMAQFGDNNTLVFYHFPADSSKPLSRYVMRAPNSSNRLRNYLALGDSFASGEGAYDYFRGTDEGESINNCHLSKKSYPYMIGQHLGLDFVRSVACSGAKIKNVVGPEFIDEDIEDDSRTNQYLKHDRIFNNELGDALPGYGLQLRALGNSSDVITISMVGNDIGFGDKLIRCLMPDNCYPYFEDRLEILREIRSKFNELVGLYEKIKDSASPEAKIYIIGYPKLANPYGSCGLNVLLSQEELEFANLTVHHLNETIESASDRVGVRYIDVEDAFDGYAFCDNKKTLAVNGLTLGNDVEVLRLRVIGKESYHPNTLGHRLYTNKILAETANFTLGMPSPNSNISTPSQENDLEFLNQPKEVRTIGSTFYYSGMSRDVIYKEGFTTLTAGNIQKYFMPDSQVNITLHSKPIDLGIFVANNKGVVSAMINIPSSTEPGFHTLKITGKDKLGNQIVFEKIVYVAQNEKDMNGNAVLDADEPCGVFPASGQDEDADGLDDACDSEITEVISPNPNKQTNPPIANIYNSVAPALSENTVISSPDRPAISSEVKSAFIDGSLFAQEDLFGHSPSKGSVAADWWLEVFVLVAGASLLIFLYRLGYAKSK